MKKFRGYRKRTGRFLRANRQLYAWGALVVLLLSTVLWSLPGARLQQGNSDQLADGFLFENSRTFHQALFPAEHTLLLKWPLFWLLKPLHYSAGSYSVLTVLLALASVSALAFVLYRIIRQPLIFGTLCLALACVLVLVPAQIFSGVTAPLNMAMLTGRNIEYLIYIGVLVLYARSRRTISRQWIAATLLLTLLLASDQLFVSLSLGGSLLLLGLGYCYKHKQLVSIAGRWFTGSAAAWLSAKILLWIIGKHVTGIVQGSSGPYSLINSWSSVLPAARYALKGLAFNFGITAAASRLTIIPALANLVIAAAILAASYRLIKKLCLNEKPADIAVILSAMLLAATAAAFAAYIVTIHPYESDARYLAIGLFAGFVTLAACLRSIKLNNRTVLFAGTVLFLATVLGLLGVQRHTNRVMATDLLRQRNQLVAKALQEHPEEILVGNYWRVLPIKDMTADARQAIIPLRSCVGPTESLRSNAWLQDLRQHSFAYVLSLRPSGIPSQLCNLHMIEFVYGPPSSIRYISGNRYEPIELLLFYDHGAANTGH